MIKKVLSKCKTFQLRFDSTYIFNLKFIDETNFEELKLIKKILSENNIIYKILPTYDIKILSQLR